MRKLEIFLCTIIIIILILSLLFVSITSCGSYVGYNIKHNYTTNNGWKLDIRNVDVTKEWLSELDNRLERINACLFKEIGNMINKDKTIIKFVEQVYFSKCDPPAGQETEEFLPDDAPQFRCEEKKELAGRDKCPCKWRTLRQGNNIIVPMVSGKTRVDQLNLWSLLEVYTDIYFWGKPFAYCWNIKKESQDDT